jgi:hypothetical protein
MAEFDEADETFDAEMKLLKNMKIYEKQMEESRKNE